MKDLERAGNVAGRVVGVLGFVVLLLSLFRLDGAGVGLGVMLSLYGLGLLLLSGIYGELKAVREALRRWDG